ncbi:amidase [Halomonas sp. MC140]|nr:amidase [Halomonas sp. MC140]MDN7131249.1 amidase [Halomonas sp. MC140]
MKSNDLVHSGLVEIAQLIQSGAISAVEVTETMLKRIDEIDGTYMSYLHICSEHALARAEIADVEIAKGIYKGPLHGVPIAVKDLCYTNFAPTSWGTTIYADFVPDYNATVVSRLLSSGAVLLGKLTMTEGAYTSHHPNIPAPPNPWGHDLWVGSSSTGSAVATAAGLCYGSLGTDTGGSIRFPSATCGLTGIKPTWGRVSRHGIFALADTLDHVGPMARSAQDCAAILQVIAGWDLNDPTSIDSPVQDYMAEVGRSIRDMRIGIDRDYALSGVDDEVAEALENAIATFQELGARIVDIKIPHQYEELVSKWIMMCSVEAAVAHEETYPARANEYGPEFVQLIDQGRSTSGIDVARVTKLRREFTEELTSMFSGIDCMLIPTMPVPIPTLEKMGEYGEDPSVLNGILRFTAPFDFSGHPTITLPNGVDSRGLPLSMQLVAPRLHEDTLVRAGHAYQTMTTWHRKVPKELA